MIRIECIDYCTFVSLYSKGCDQPIGLEQSSLGSVCTLQYLYHKASWLSIVGLLQHFLWFPSQFAGIHSCTWVERNNIKQSCLSQRKNTVAETR